MIEKEQNSREENEPNLPKSNGHVVVHDLDDPTFSALYLGIPPEKAVIAAYAQSLGDYNTWNYLSNYLWMLRMLPNSFSCGSFATARR